MKIKYKSVIDSIWLSVHGTIGHQIYLSCHLVRTSVRDFVFHPVDHSVHNVVWIPLENFTRDCYEIKI